MKLQSVLCNCKCSSYDNLILNITKFVSFWGYSVTCCGRDVSGVSWMCRSMFGAWTKWSGSTYSCQVFLQCAELFLCYRSQVFRIRQRRCWCPNARNWWVCCGSMCAEVYTCLCVYLKEGTLHECTNTHMLLFNLFWCSRNKNKNILNICIHTLACTEVNGILKYLFWCCFEFELG